jgi:hypothetical protein
MTGNDGSMAAPTSTESPSTVIGPNGPGAVMLISGSDGAAASTGDDTTRGKQRAANTAAIRRTMIDHSPAPARSTS